MLSRGRLDLGVGIGWQREEYEAAGLDFGARGRLLDHSLEVCRTLWREQRASFDVAGARASTAIHAMPKPVQPGGVPIWVSGRCNAARGAAPRPLRERLAPLGRRRRRPRGEPPPHARGGRRGRVATVPRSPAMGSLPLRRRADRSVDPAATMDRVPGLVEAGVTDFRLHVPVPDSYAGARDVYTEIVAAFRETSGA